MEAKKDHENGPAMPRIYTIRRQRVVLSSDLAVLYGVEPKRLNEAVSRNAERFPPDFCFILTREEYANLKSQIATSSLAHGGARKPPIAFTEHGCLMAATVLRSEKAVQMSLYLVRAFVQMREQISSNLGVLRRLAEIDKKLLEHDSVLREVVERLSPLLNPPPEDEAAKPKIGYHRGNR
jgi:phage regulator Rha-like protein